MAILDDLYNPTIDNDFRLHFDANANKGAVQFTPTKSGLIGQIDFKLWKTGSPSGDIWVEIWSDNGSDLPNAQIGGNSIVKTAASVSQTASPGGTYSFTWSASTPSIIAATKYWAVFNCDYANSTSNYISQGNKVTDNTRETAAFDTSSWNAQGYSTWFNQYYIPPSASILITI